MSELSDITYRVPGIHCEHCEMSVREEVSEVVGVEAVEIDLEKKLVSVRGTGIDDAAIRAAIAEAGYEAV